MSNSHANVFNAAFDRILYKLTPFIGKMVIKRQKVTIFVTNISHRLLDRNLHTLYRHPRWVAVNFGQFLLTIGYRSNLGTHTQWQPTQFNLADSPSVL